MIINPYSFLTLPLDLVTGAYAGFSVARKIRALYSGSAIRVRRAGDNAETDIGFTSLGLLDTAAVVAHCTTNEGYVTTVYDQSGNARNMTQTTAANQPKVYDGLTQAVLLGSTGKPLFHCDGGSDFIQTANDAGHVQPVTQFLVWQPNSWTANEPVTDGRTSFATLQQITSSPQYRIFAGTALGTRSFTNGSAALATIKWNGGSSYFQKNVESALIGNAGATNPTGFTFGAFQNGTGPPSDVKFHECLIYQSLVSNTITSNLQYNLNRFYRLW